MRITPIDIERKQFDRRMRGYSSAEVNAFLREVAGELENLLDEKETLTKQVESLESELKRYREMESTLNNALLLAQKTADEMREAARREAEVTVREAKEQANRDLEQMRRDLEGLQRERDRFTMEFRALLHTHLQMIEGEKRAGRAEQPPAE